MLQKTRTWAGAFACIAMIVMILDSTLVVRGALEGIQLCTQTVIPSLFPFFLISGYVNFYLSGNSIKWMRYIGKICKIPKGCESLLLLGIFGGYPVGAQNIRQAYDMGSLSKSDAQRMLGFCNNAGPSFIFGLLSHFFASPFIPWLLWFVHILSAIVVALILPREDDRVSIPNPSIQETMPNIMTQALRAIGSVCGWIVFFRVILAITSHRLLRNRCTVLQIILAGFMELTNGCCSLKMLSEEWTRFILCAGFLGFGGCCVMLQTKSVIKELSIHTYVLGKVLHCGISLIIASVLSSILYHQSIPWYYIIAGALITILGYFLLFRKNSSNFSSFGVQYQHINI